MYPDLSYLFHDVFGTPMDNWTAIFKTFGLILAITFLICTYILRIELKRKEEEGLLSPILVRPNKFLKPGMMEALVNGFIIGLAGCKVPYISQHFTAFKNNPASIIFSTAGNLWLGLLIGLCAAAFFYFKYKDDEIDLSIERIHPYQKVGDIIVLAFVSGIIGARLFSIFENFGDFLNDPIGQLFSGSGLTVYGGFILGFISVALYVRSLDMKMIHVMDIAAPILAVGYGFGRLGCHFAGDGDWGIDNLKPKPDWFIFPDWAWAYDYPNNVLKKGNEIAGCYGDYCYQLINPVYPTPIWETTISLIFLGLLWFLRKRLKIAGMLFFIYMILNGIARFFIEGIRINERYDLLGMDWSLSQWIGLLFAIIGLVGVFYLSKFGKTMESHIAEEKIRLKEQNISLKQAT